MPHLVVAFSRYTRQPLRLARWLTRGDSWLHTGVVVEAVVGGVSSLMVVDARFWWGVTVTPLRKWLARYPATSLRAVECPEPMRGQAAAWSMQGIKYDDIGTLSAPLALGIENPKRLYCAEVVIAAVKKALRVLFPGRPRRVGARPQELFDKCVPLCADTDPFSGRLSAWYG